MNVMIVDNDAAWVRSLSLLLAGQGWTVHAFTDPCEAWEFVEQTARTGPPAEHRSPDALILDYIMPRMNGLELLAGVGKYLEPGCRILLLTGHADQIDEAELEKRHVAAYMEKPVDLDALMKALEGDPEASSVPAAAGGRKE